MSKYNIIFASFTVVYLFVLYMVVHDSLEFHNDCDDYGQYLDDNLEHNLDGDYE